jgi:HSP20 family protein
MNTVIRWNPLREMAAMQSAMDRIFEETWRNAQPTTNGRGWIPLDVYETDTHYTIAANLPGFNPENIDVTLHDGTLTISGEIPQPQVDDNVRVLLQERFFGKFSRSVNLPLAVNAEGVESNYANGVLTLTLPKAEEVQPRRIPIKSAPLLHNSN